MKKIFTVVLVLVVIACKQEPRDYVTLSGKISNPHETNSIRIYKGNEYEKIVSVNEDGTFTDTLKVLEGDYRFKHGDEYGSIYLKNNNTSSFTFDYEDTDATLIYEGDASCRVGAPRSITQKTCFVWKQKRAEASGRRTWRHWPGRPRRAYSGKRSACCRVI